MSFNKTKNIIEALGKHEDESSIAVLETLGTNSENDEIREMTAQALIKKNTHNSLAMMITSKGKGINDLSARVAMGTINELLSLEDKTEAIQILEDTIEMHSDEEVKETARSVKTLMTYTK